MAYNLRALERYREWFPPADVVFELRGLERTYKTYVDRANRLRLHDILAYHSDVAPGDYLVFTPISGSRDWRVVLEKSTHSIQTRLQSESKGPRRRRPIAFDHSSIQKMLVSMASHFEMHPQEEFKYEHYVYDVIWTRVASGNPVKVFEVQVSGSLEAALTKLKHARDTWNADLFLIVSSPKDADKAEYLLSGSFHEMRAKTSVLVDSEVYEMLTHKERFADIEKQLRR